MGTVHSGKISHLTWTFPKKYWAVLGCTGLYWAVLGHLRYLLGNVQVKWRILPLCNGWWLEDQYRAGERVRDLIMCPCRIRGALLLWNSWHASKPHLHLLGWGHVPL